MSHLVSYSAVVIPEAAVTNGTLAQAVAECGGELMVGQTKHNWYGRVVGGYNGEDAAARQGIRPADYGKCLHAIRVKGAASADYEIGLVKAPSGDGLVPVFDTWGASGGRLAQHFGAKAEKLGTAYSRAAIRRQAKLSGYTVREEQLEGKLRLTLTATA